VLFFVAALLYTSVHVLGVTGAPSTPALEIPGAQQSAAPVSNPRPVENASRRSSAASGSVRLASAELISDSAVRTSPVFLSAPVEGVPALSTTLSACGADHDRATTSTAAGRISAPDCLTQLGEAAPAPLARFAASFGHDDTAALAFAAALGERGSALATNAWWRGLAPEARGILISTIPAVVGNLEGIPYRDRDAANRITLTSTIARLTDGSSSGGLDGDARQLVMLQQVRIALDRGREGDDARRSLLSLDTVFPGKAAVAVGNVDTADNVTMMVPGMLYTVSNQVTWWTDRAADLHSEQDFWSSTLATRATKTAASNATIAWMGYRTPDLTNVLGLSLAKAGAVHLEDAVAGLKAARTGAEPHVTLIAHSYGSTTATIALTSGKIHVDSFVILGSPGSVVSSASKLDVTRGNVYAAAAALDPVAGSGVFGIDPGSTAFGATLLNIAGGTDPYTEQHLTAVLTHNRYFTPGSQSMRNLALIGIGRGSLAGGRAPSPNGPALANQPSVAYVRPQDINREALGA